MLAKEYKLKKNNDIKRVFEKGKYFQKGVIGIKLIKNNSKINRFGFLVGLKISKKSTERNKIKRWLNEIIRLNLSQIKKGYDIIIMVKTEIKEKKYQEVESNLIGLLEKIKLIKKK